MNVLAGRFPAAGWLCCLLVCSELFCCGGTTPPVQRNDNESPPLRMHHQILFRHGEDQHVFDGYMLVYRTGYIVKAFAGPGIDLFTVVKRGAQSKAVLHLPGLQDRMDMRAISQDIARIYALPCGPKADRGSVSCLILGEMATEKYDQEGRLISRHFARAHGVGLDISYSDYRRHLDRDDPYRMHLKWGHGQVEMIIILGRLEIARELDPGLLEKTFENLK